VNIAIVIRTRRDSQQTNLTQQNVFKFVGRHLQIGQI